MIILRVATTEDAATLASLHRSSSAEGWSEKAFSDLFASPGTFGLLAGDSEASVGLVVARVAADEAEILTLAVLQDARRRGIGARLVTAAAGVAAQRGAATLFLEVATDNRPARSLYGKLGFREVGCRPGYYRSGEGLIMRADLPLGQLGNGPEVD